MKKLIAILVVFAVVAGAAFAQDEGSWSVGSSGTIGTKLDFIPMEGVEAGHATTSRAGDFRGNLDLTYSKGGLSTGLGINQNSITAKLSFSGENFQFGAEQSLGDLIGLFNGIYTDNYDYGADPDGRLPTGHTVTDEGLYWEVTNTTVTPNTTYTINKFGNSFLGGGGRGKLWGNYTFDVLNGLKLQVSAAGDAVNAYTTTEIFGDTYTKKLGGNYLWLDVSPMDGLNVGFVLPGIFGAGDFVSSLKNIGFGAKFSADALAVGFQFVLGGPQPPYFKKGDPVKINTSADLKAGLYLGATYKISDEMSAGLEFRGDFGGGQKTDKDGNLSDAVGISIGAKFDFSSGDFGAGVTIKFADNDAGKNDGTETTTLTNLTAHNQTFEINPYVQYNLNPDYLQFKLEAGFTFLEVVEKTDGTVGTDAKSVWAGVIKYSFTPSLTFNFLGTGAGGWDTGFQIKYNVAGPLVVADPNAQYPNGWNGFFDPYKGRNATNNLEIVFKWKL